MQYCSHCGSAQIQLRVPDGDNRVRNLCNNCGAIFYENPKIICGSLAVSDRRILLCKRGIEPRAGYWTLPAGFMENGETTLAAACRETQEEALAELVEPELYCVFSLPHISQVYLFFRGEILQGQYGVGEETTDAQLFPIDDIPWDTLAFRTVSRALLHYKQDLDTGHFPVRVEDIIL